MAKVSNKDVPYIVHESILARLERVNRRIFIVAMLAIVLLFVTNALWLWNWSQYDYASTEVEMSQDGGGTNIIGSGNRLGTETSNKDQNTKEEKW